MRKKPEVENMEEEINIEQRRKERIRMYLISVAELNQLIVKELRLSMKGLSKDDIVKRFSDYSLQQIEDALESAIEDEYIEVETRDADVLWYCSVKFEEP